jgi:hypothetical protein
MATNGKKKAAGSQALHSDSLSNHLDTLDELSKRVHAAMVDLNLADADDPPPGCHWEFILGPGGVKKKLVC